MKTIITILLFSIFSFYSFAINDTDSDSSSSNQKDDAKVTIENISQKLSLEQTNVSLFISSDNTVLVFSSSENEDNGQLYYTEYNTKKNEWTTPTEVSKGFVINNKEVLNKIKKEQKALITSRLGKNRNTIYKLYDNNNKSKKPKKVKIPVKLEETHACLSPDGNTLFFSADIYGGYGGKDIYASDKQTTGKWSKPYNLGEEVNTKEDEDAPFILNDNSTLYFSSKGHNSMGGYDIFNTTISDDGFWTDIFNLGQPINTKDDDINFIMSQDELQAFYSSGEEGKLDIYKVTFKNIFH